MLINTMLQYALPYSACSFRLVLAVASDTCPSRMSLEKKNRIFSLLCHLLLFKLCGGLVKHLAPRLIFAGI